MILARCWVAGCWVLVGWVLLTGCGGQQTVFDKTHVFDEQSWSYADSVAFTFSVLDTSGKYDLVLSVEHHDDFAYQNFYIHLSTYLPDDTRIQQRLSLQLADNFGEWYGECSGEVCTTEIALQEATRFTEPGNHRLVITQYSRDEPLRNINALGFRIVKP